MECCYGGWVSQGRIDERYLTFHPWPSLIDLYMYSGGLIKFRETGLSNHLMQITYSVNHAFYFCLETLES